MEASLRAPRPYLILVVTALAAAIALSLVSVHMRLLNSGLGCSEWPACYGQIALQSPADPATTGTARAAPGWATTTHRVLASGLGLLILAISLAALRPDRKWIHRPAALSLLAVMVGLAVLGRWSAGLTIPGVVMANYVGGLLMTGLLWWLCLTAAGRYRPAPTPADGKLNPWVMAGMTLLVLQITLGGMMSAWFAALSCGPSPTCDGNWAPFLPLDELARAFQPLELDASGRVVTGESMTGLHMAHRWLGMIMLPLFAVIARLAWLSGRRAAAVGVMALTVAELLLGAAAIRFDLSPTIVLGHYLLALALLLAMLDILSRSDATMREEAIQ